MPGDILLNVILFFCLIHYYTRLQHHGTAALCILLSIFSLFHQYHGSLTIIAQRPFSSLFWIILSVKAAAAVTVRSGDLHLFLLLSIPFFINSLAVSLPRNAYWERFGSDQTSSSGHCTSRSTLPTSQHCQ